MLSVDTSHFKGPIEKSATVHTNDASQRQAVLQMKGKVKTIIDVEPQERFLFSVFKGQGAEREITISNNDEKPLNIIQVITPRKHLTTQLQTITPGKKYKLVVKLNPETPVGSSSETVNLQTDNYQLKVPPIYFSIYVRNLVTASPSTVYFSNQKFENLEKLPESILTRVITVRKQKDAKDFKVEKVTSDAQFVTVDLEEVPPNNATDAKTVANVPKDKIASSGNLSALNPVPEPERPAKESDGRIYKITVKLLKDKLKKGDKLDGSISVLTNDKEVPIVKIPIKGSIL